MHDNDFSDADNFKIDGYELRLTCSACPEQYEVYLLGSQVGYLRLRHGYFTVTVPDVSGQDIYSSMPEGDGVFANAQEREKELREAVWAIDAELGAI